MFLLSQARVEGSSPNKGLRVLQLNQNTEITVRQKNISKEKEKKMSPFAVIVRDPLLLSLSQKGVINQLLLNGNQCHMLEAKEVHSSKIMLQLHLFHNHHIFDADSKVPFLIISRLVGHLVCCSGQRGIIMKKQIFSKERKKDITANRHSGFEREFIRGDPGADSMRTLMHVEVCPNTVTCSVTVV